MPTRYEDQRLRTAVELTPAETYTQTPDGGRYPQTTRPDLIHRMLAMLDVEPGQSVLEIGTGSGYSTALLSRLVGDDGVVVSIDVDPEPAARARALLKVDGRTNATVIVTDGREGHPDGGPYDRIIGWATLNRWPEAWTQQLSRDAVVVAPFATEDGTRSIRYRYSSGALAEEARIPSGFIPATAAPFRPWEQEESTSGS